MKNYQRGVSILCKRWFPGKVSRKLSRCSARDQANCEISCLSLEPLHAISVMHADPDAPSKVSQKMNRFARDKGFELLVLQEHSKDKR